MICWDEIGNMKKWEIYVGWKKVVKKNMKLYIKWKLVMEKIWNYIWDTNW